MAQPQPFISSKVTRALNDLTGYVSIASATALIVPSGRVFFVTGTTNVTSIEGILTFTDGNNLKLAGNLVTSADDTISLAYNGTNWYETGRSVN